MDTSKYPTIRFSEMYVRSKVPMDQDIHVNKRTIQMKDARRSKCNAIVRNDGLHINTLFHEVHAFMYSDTIIDALILT